MKTRNTLIALSLLGGFLASSAGQAAVSADEAAALKTTLTPLGAEKAGNKDGSIPAWTGGYSTVPAGFKPGNRRPDPFSAEKPLFSITAKNMAQYADKLSDGAQAMLKKYPDSYHIDVYPTHRTAVAPQWVYDNTFKNATRANLVEGAAGPMVEGAYGGIPFPIPKTGAEVMWNALLAWRGESWSWDGHNVLITPEGKAVVTANGPGQLQMPYYFKDGETDFKGEYWMLRRINAGPPIRAGEGILSRLNLDPENDRSWVYLTGQRRVRRLPNSCCDTPLPSAAGVLSIDEVSVYTGRMDTFNWKLLGKKEIFVPYNANKILQPTSNADVLGEHHLNPEHVRWELHRVWVVEASLAPGKRHLAPKSIYYIDEDTWMPLLGDRWDKSDRLWKTMWQMPFVMPDIPAVHTNLYGFYDLVSGAWFTIGIMNETTNQYSVSTRYKDSFFSPDSLAAEGVR
ncbi:DUF1329 domain-containing protein [Denitromonas iodatirespirans]|uniref:DUF1329 domain-containing protein n=1 Tax=Denitromonas iodatirespirans TaxID=2795389 RepID=A0A944DAV6_DENI1|nr:DUF1329 domain-containing protein [Denitromonas iodatirespirans]MBT0961183.1 DUF1329 domain-containing protein [Denitromonas iodatirespirans]